MGTSLIDRVRNRRNLAAFALLTFAYSVSFSVAGAEERRLEMYNIHTKKEISIVFKRDGKFVPEALKQVNDFMGDWRRKSSTKMDPELIDLIWEIHRELGSKKPVHLISGYRSPKTNAMLRKTRGGQATKSKHMTGEAADIHFPDISVKQLRNSALIRERGGVGYYPTSAIPFVHVDTGRVRHWPRLPRQELAILFPEGKSKHVPTDGKRLTKKDFQVALADLQKKGGELPIAVQRRLEGDGSARTVLASLSPKVPVPVQAPEKPPKMVFASLNPFEGLTRGSSVQRPEQGKPLVQTSLQPSQKDGGRAGAFDRDFGLGKGKPSALVPEDQMASSPEYDDDHPDELNYQPFPILPFMTDTPVAAMELNGNPDALNLRKVHLLFGESQQMLLNEFEPGPQYGLLYGAQNFRGSAVNTGIKRLVRDESPPREPVQTAQRKTTRTAQK
ncbi:MAG: DUF882 domain-containing protein [Rhodomicrobiaceae bacterium]